MGELFDTELVINRLRATNPDMSDHALLQMRQHFDEHHLTPEDLGQLHQGRVLKKWWRSISLSLQKVLKKMQNTSVEF